MNERIPLMRSVFSDEAFVNACLEAESEEAVQKLFAEKDIEMSLGEIELLKEMIGAVASGEITGEELEKLANGGELSEDELAEAAGGCSWLTKLFTSPDVEYTVDNIAVISKRLRHVSVPKVLAGAAVGVIAVGGAAYGICKACGVNVGDGVKSACSWVADKVTSRW